MELAKNCAFLNRNLISVLHITVDGHYRRIFSFRLSVARIDQGEVILGRQRFLYYSTNNVPHLRAGFNRVRYVFIGRILSPFPAATSGVAGRATAHPGHCSKFRVKRHFENGFCCCRRPLSAPWPCQTARGCAEESERRIGEDDTVCSRRKYILEFISAGDSQ